MLYLTTPDYGFQIGLAVVIGAMTIFFSLIKPLISITQFFVAQFQAAVAAGATKVAALSTAASATLGGGLAVFRATLVTAVLSLIVQVGIAVGTFIFQWANGAGFGSLELNASFARLVVEIYIAFLAFALSVTVAGAVLLGVLASIDAILNILCTAKVPNTCWSITGIVVQVAAAFIYGGAPVVKFKAVEAGRLNLRLSDPQRGFIAGNRLTLSLDVATYVDETTMQEVNHQSVFSFHARTRGDSGDDAKRRTSVRYTLNAEPPDLSVNAMRNAWQMQLGGPHTLAYVAQQTAQSPEIVLQAGVNVSIPVRLNYSFALPAVECWLLNFCKLNEVKGKQTGQNLGFFLDVLPATLDAFVAWDWSPDFFVRATPLVTRNISCDLDGDGLRSLACSGNDPSTATVDADGDGIPDPKELALGNQGRRFSPLLADADGDSLNDALELRYGTNPFSADSDGDGLSDYEEVMGWDMTYGYIGVLPTLDTNGCRLAGGTKRIARVTSDPRTYDTDGDGLSDRDEKVLNNCDPIGFPFHPNVPNANPLAVTFTFGDDDGFLARGQVVPFTVTVLNDTPQVNPLNARGNLTVTRASAYVAATGPVRAFDLWRGSSLSFTGVATVLNSIPSQVAAITASAMARLYAGSPASGVDIAPRYTLPLRVDADEPNAQTTSFGNGAYLQAGATVIVGGEAADATSHVRHVEVQLNDGAWQTATSTAFWSYALAVPNAEGPHTLRARAVDAVGNVQTLPHARTFLADGTPPSVSSTIPDDDLRAAVTLPDGGWGIVLSGVSSDPNLTTGQPGSGAAYVEALVAAAPQVSGLPVPYTATWQRTEVTSTGWVLTYALPLFDVEGSVITEPTGVYTVYLRGGDFAGNVTAPTGYATFRLRLDNRAPAFVSVTPQQNLTYNGVLTQALPNLALTNTQVLSGFIFESAPSGLNSGVQTATLTLAPGDLGVAPGMWRAWYRNNLQAIGAPDYEGLAANIDFTWPGSPAPGVLADGFSADWLRQALFRVDGVYTFTIERESDPAGAIRLFVNEAQVLSAAGSMTQATAALTMTGGVHTLRVVYADGSGTARARLNVELARALPQPLILGAAGGGVLATTWRYTLPEQLEGLYQLDFGGRDVFGNVGRYASFWRGEIDTVAPRVAADVNYVGIGAASRTIYTVRATDFNLTQEGFVSPCGDPTPEERFTYDTSWWREWINDSTRLYEIVQRCERPGHVTEPPRIRACDIHGRCADTYATPPGAPNNRSVYYSSFAALYRKDLASGETRVAWPGWNRSVGWMFTDSPNGRLLIVSYASGGNALEVIDLNTGALSATFTLPSLTGATGFAFDPVNSWLYVADYSNVLGRLNTWNGQYVTVTLPHRIGWALGYDWQNQRLFARDGEFDRMFPAPQQRESARMRFLLPSGVFQGYIGDSRPPSFNYLDNRVTGSNRPPFWTQTSIAVDPASRQIFWWGNQFRMYAAPYPNDFSAINDGLSIGAPNFYTVTTIFSPTQPFPQSGLSSAWLRLYVDTPTAYSPTLKLYFVDWQTAIIKRMNISNTLFVSLEDVVTETAGMSSGFNAFQTFAVDVNHRPVANSQALVTDMNAPISFTLTVSDTDRNPLSFRILTPFGRGTLSDWPTARMITAPTVLYAPNAGFSGYDRLDYEVDDHRGGVITGTVSVRVRPPLVLESSVVTPTNGATHPALTPITLGVATNASEAVRRITVTVNGVPALVSPILNQANPIWTTTWTPTPGRHTLDSIAEDVFGRVQTMTAPISLTVAITAPQLTLGGPTITGSASPGEGAFFVSGLVTAFADLRALTVTLSGPGLNESGAAMIDDGVDVLPNGARRHAWRYLVQPPAAYNPAGITIAATTLDAANRTATAAAPATVDIVPPTLVSTSLFIVSGTALIPITAGLAIRDGAPTLAFTWASAGDPSGLQDYVAGWTQSSAFAPTTVLLPSQPRRLDRVTGEAQTWFAHLSARDVLGNPSRQTLGPIIVDAPTTPDVTMLGFSHWLESGATQVGVHPRARCGDVVTGTTCPQSFYVTWDALALRLAYTGGNWDSDGDLWLFFDTQSGGATRDPLNRIGMPEQPLGADQPISLLMRPDYAVRVVSAQTATLYTWSGSAWQIQRNLTAAEFAFTPGDVPRTDLRLLWTSLGIATPANTAFGLLAVALADDGRVIAWMPNPSPEGDLWRTTPVTPTAWLRWSAAASGMRPNAGRFVASDVQVAAQGIARTPDDVLIVNGARRWLTDLPPVLVGLPQPPGATLATIGPNRAVTFTLSYTNAGIASSDGLSFVVTASGALNLSGGNVQTLTPAPVTPSAGGVLTLTGVTSSSGLAQFDVALRDAPRRTYDWFSLRYLIDITAPVSLSVSSPLSWLNPLTNTFNGAAFDLSPLAVVTVEIQPGVGAPVVQACLQPTGNGGVSWSCRVNLNGMTGSVTVRARAADIWGNVSGWTVISSWQVDDALPTLTLDAQTESLLANGYFGNHGRTEAGRGVIPLRGALADERQSQRIVACTRLPEQNTCPTEQSRIVEATAFTTNLALDTELAFLYEGDAVSQVLELQGFDAVGNRSNLISRTVWIDTVPPQITATQVLSEVFDVDFGSVPVQQAVITGAVSDGALRVVRGWLMNPAGEITAYTATVTGGQWVLTPTLSAGAYGSYTLTVEAWDKADNRSAALIHTFSYKVDSARLQVGVRRVDVVGTELASSVPIAPGLPMTYQVTVRNTGGLTATQPATVTVAWPALLSAPTCSATGGASCAFDGIDLRIVWPVLARGAQHTATLSGLPPASLADGVSILASAALTSAGVNRPEFSTLNAQIAHTTSVQSALSVHKSTSADSVFASDLLTFTVRITNTGGALLRSLTLTDLLPSGYSVVTYSVVGQGGVIADCALGSTVTCALRRPLRVLYVDDNESSSSYWRRVALEQIAQVQGWQLSVIATYGDANGPAAATLLQHDLVIWDSFTKVDLAHQGPSQYDARQLAAYVSGGGRLILGTPWFGAFANPAVPSARYAWAAELLSATLRVDPSGFQPKLTFDPSFTRGFTGANAFAGVFRAADATSYQPSYVPVLSGGALGFSYLDTGSNPAAVYTARTLMLGFAPVVHLALVDGGSVLQLLLVRAAQTLNPPEYSLGSGQSVTLTVIGAPTVVGTRTNTAQAQAANAALTSASVSYSALVSTALQGQAQPAALSMLAGDALSVTAWITNAGPSAATNVVVTTAVPAGALLDSYAGDGLSCGALGGVITCTTATLNVGASTGVVVTLTASGGGHKQMTFWRQSDQSARRGAPAQFLVTGNANLRLASASASASGVTAGLGLTLTVVAANDGPQSGDAVLTATVSGWLLDSWQGMVLPDAALMPGTAQITGATDVAMSAAGGGWGDGQLAITLSVPLLASGGRITAEIPLRVHPAVLSGTVLTARAGVTTSLTDATPGDNLAVPLAITATAQANLRLSKQVLSPDVLVNQPITYVVTLVNDGPSAVHGLVITDPVPTSHSFLRGSALVNGWARGCVLSGSVAHCSLTGLPRSALIVNDNTVNYALSYENALDALGIPWARVNVTETNDGPSAAFMSAYDVVIWVSHFQGSYPSGIGPSANDEAQLRQYLANGGSLLLESLGYADARGGLTAFMTETLGLAGMAINGLPAMNDQAVGAGLFNSFGVMNISSMSSADVLTPTIEAQTVLRWYYSSAPQHSVGVWHPSRRTFYLSPATYGQFGTNPSWLGLALSALRRAPLMPGSAADVTLIFTAPASSQNVVNTAYARADGGNAVTTSAPLPVIGWSAFDVNVDGPASALSGDMLTYVVVFTQTGIETAGAVTLTHMFIGADRGSADWSGMSCDTSHPRLLTCTIPSLAISSSRRVTVTALTLGWYPAQTITSAAHVRAVNAQNSAGYSAQRTTSLTPLVDLSLGIVAPTNLPAAGTALAGNIVVTNAGMADAPGVVITAAALRLLDATPLAFTGCDVRRDQSNEVITDAVCVANAGGLTATVGIPADWINGRARVEFSVTLPISLTHGELARLSARARPSLLAVESAPTDNAAQVDVSVVGSADLRVAVFIPQPMTPTAGLPMTYVAVIRNDGLQAASDVIVTSTAARMFFNADPAPPVVACSATTGTCATSGATAVITWPTLNAGAAQTITLVTLPQPDLERFTVSEFIERAITVTSALADLNPADNEAVLTSAVQTLADYQLGFMLVATETPRLGNITYTVYVTNAGPSTMVQPHFWLTASDALNPFYSLPDGYPCSNAGRLECQVAIDLAPGESRMLTGTVTLYADPPTSAPITATAAGVGSLAPPDPQPANNVVTTPVRITYPSTLYLSLTPSANPLGADQRVTFTVNITREGPDVILRNITIPVPLNLSPIEVWENMGYWPARCAITETLDTPSGQSFACHTLGVGASGAQVFVVLEPDTADFDFAMTARAHGDWAALAIGQSPTVTVIRPVADLAIAQRAETGAGLLPGDALTYTIVVTNLGPLNATAVQVTSTAHGAISLTLCEAQSGSCTIVGDGIAAALGTLAPSVSRQITVLATLSGALPLGAPVTHTTFVTTTAVDDALANNRVTATVQVRDYPILGLALASNAPQPPAPDGLAHLTATVIGGTNVSLTWALGDGNVGYGPTVTHAYSVPFTPAYTLTVFMVVVTASNSAGFITASLPITIQEGALQWRDWTAVWFESTMNTYGESLAGQSFTMHVYLTRTASNVQVAVNWADGTVVTRSASLFETGFDSQVWRYAVFTHTYSTGGEVDPITVTAFNRAGVIGPRTPFVRVRQSILDAGLNFSLTAPAFTAIGMPTPFTLTTSGGYPLNFSYDFDTDGTFDDWGGWPNLRQENKLWAYTAPGLHTATVVIENDLDYPFNLGVNYLTLTAQVWVSDYVPIEGLTAFNSSPTALGGTTQFTAAQSSGNLIAYVWNFGDGVTATTTQTTISHFYALPGTYTATVTATNAVNQRVTTTAVVVQQAVAGLSASTSGPTFFGQPTALAAALDAGWPVSFAWALGDGNVSYGPLVNHVYPAIGSYTAVVTAFNALGAQVASVMLVITDAPPVGLSASASGPARIGEPVQFAATVAGGSSLNYEWEFGDGVRLPVQNPIHAYDAPGVFTATVRVWNATGALSASVPVTVLIAPLQAAAQVAANKDEGIATITVSLAAPLPMAVGVPYATVDGTAQAGSDYVYIAGVLTFAPSETVKVVTVLILDDGTAEPDEWFSVYFQPPDPALGQMQMMGRLNVMSDASLQQGEVVIVRVLIPGANRMYLPTVWRMQ